MTANEIGSVSSGRAGVALRIFVAGLAHETNSFSPLPTSVRNFEQDICYRPGNPLHRGKALAFPGYGDAIRIARARGDEAIEGPCFWTQPSGPPSAVVYQSLRDEILSALRAAGPVDVVILNLHGAMMAQGIYDCEGDLLTEVRDLVGPRTPVGSIVDLHGNLSTRMIESGAIIVGCKEYPHIDYPARTAELYAILDGMARRGVQPRTALRRIPLLGLQGTTEEPMAGLVRDLREAEGQNGVLSLTLMHGFPWADSLDAGASLLAVFEGSQTAAIDAVTAAFAERFTRIATALRAERMNVTDAVGAALTAPRGPVVIADGSDNPGGGAACDSTFLLRELIDRGTPDAALGMIWDPQAAQIAADAGVGARMRMRIGGKVGPLSGDPIDLDVEVLCVRADAMQRNLNGEQVEALGLAVALRAGGIDVVVNSIRQQVFSRECFTELGIDVAQKAICVVKSTQHFRAAFDPIAEQTIYCNAPGSLNLDLASLPYRNLRVVPNGAAFSVMNRDD